MTEPVECRSDSTYAETPAALTWQGERLEVETVLSRWRGPGERGFRVRLVDGRTFELVYDEAGDRWRIQPI